MNTTQQSVKMLHKYITKWMIIVNIKLSKRGQTLYDSNYMSYQSWENKVSCKKSENAYLCWQGGKSDGREHEEGFGRLVA